MLKLKNKSLSPYYAFSGGRVSSRAEKRSTFTARQSLALHKFCIFRFSMGCLRK